VVPFHDGAENIVHLERNDKDGNLYYLNLNGEVRRISYGGNPAPVAVLEADQFYGPSPLNVQFDGTGSSDDSGPIAGYRWDFGDGTTSTEAQPEHVFQATGNQPQSFTVSLTVADQMGASHKTTAIISLNNTPPQAHISSIRPGEHYPTEETTVLRLAADVVDQDHTEDELEYEWRVFFHHNEHFHPEPVDYNTESFVVINPVGCGQEEYYYRIELTVTDAAGLSDTDQRILLPNCAEKFVGTTHLNAAAGEDRILLDWTTEFEREVVEMTVQRSSDHFHFENIGDIHVLGDELTGASYTFTDPNPIRGNNIYRIRFRQDSAYTYTNLVRVVFPAPPAVHIYPNPAGAHFKVKVRRAQSERLHFRLFTATGAGVLQREWEAVPGQTFERLVLPDDLARGIYFYELINGKETAAGRLVLK
jgi:hypothetical protein